MSREQISQPMSAEQLERLAQVAEFWASKLATQPSPTERLAAERQGRAMGYRQMADVLRCPVLAQVWCNGAERNGFEPCR